MVWGLFFAVLLGLEKLLPVLKNLPTLLRHCYVLLAVIVSFVIFNATDMGLAIQDLKEMFGFAAVPMVNSETLYYLRSYTVTFALGIIGATPLAKICVQRLPEKLVAILEPLALIGLLLACTAYLVDGSFNPFLYFRF